MKTFKVEFDKNTDRWYVLGAPADFVGGEVVLANNVAKIIDDARYTMSCMAEVIKAVTE